MSIKIFNSPKILVVFTVLSLVMCLVFPSFSFSYEKEELPTGKYATDLEKKLREQHNFSLQLSIGTGVSFSDQTIGGFFIGLDKTGERFFNTLGLEFSENILTAELTGIYTLGTDLGFYVAIPGGWVETQPEDVMLPGIVEYNAGIGDVRAGGFYKILSETDYAPAVTILFEGNARTAKFSSLGDGVWDATGGLKARKFVLAPENSYSILPTYLFFSADYTSRFDRKDIEMGDVVGYGGGIGVLPSSGQVVMEIGVKNFHAMKTQFKDGTEVFDSSNSLRLTIDTRLPTKGFSFYLYMDNVNKGFDRDLNFFGFGMRTQLFPWSF